MKLESRLQIIFCNVQSNFPFRGKNFKWEKWLPGKYQVEVIDAYFTNNHYFTSVV